MTMPTPPHPAARRAFTLVELLISLGIALLLIYGINLVFRAVTDTVRVGNALSVAMRKMRSVDSAVTLDFEGTPVELNPDGKKSALTKGDVDQRWSGIVPIVTDITPPDYAVATTLQPRQPAITIFCKRTFAFANRADEDADVDKVAASLDEDESGTEFNFQTTTDPAELARINSRVHRTDTIGFFAGGSFVPRAIRPNQIEAAGVAQQAWVWYGHALQHNDVNDFQIPTLNDLKRLAPYDATAGVDGRFMQPGVGTAATNPRNYYASNWVLGRMAVSLLLRGDATNIFPGVPKLGPPSATPIRQVFAEAGGTSPALIDFSAEERNIRYAIGDPTSSDFNPSLTGVVPADNKAMPRDNKVATNLKVPFTSALNDVGSVWPGPAANAAVLPTGAAGPLTGTNQYIRDNFLGLVRRYDDLQFTSDPANWWQRSMTQYGDPKTPLRFNSVSSFSRPVLTQGQLNDASKAAMQATYLAEGCTQFIVEFAGDFCAQNALTGAVTTNKPDGIIDFRITGTGTREIQWYGLPRDVDGDGVADVVRVYDKVLTAQTFEKSLSTDAENYAVAFGPEELYPPGGTAADSRRPWLIRLTANLNDVSSNLGTGLQREFVFKIR